MKGVIKQVGRYVVGEAIGEGSFGKVYKGIDQLDKSEVALKFISKRGKNKKQLEGLRTQNEMLKKICHKNIIKLLDFHETPNQMIIITEFAGENLSDVLEKKKNFTYEQVKFYCKQIFEALCYLDQNRIAHRDLKPQNILIQNQVIKICDFGFARKLSASTTYMNSLKGTPLYIAPEILGNGPLNYTKKVDVWSFGIIIYELYTGRTPFYAENLPKLKPKILHEKVRFPKEMPVEIRSVIDRMLQKHPEGRADWQELRKFQFFSSGLPLKQVSQNIVIRQTQKEEYLKLGQEPPLSKQQSDKGIMLTPEKKAKLNRLASIQDIEEIKKIQSELLSLKTEAKKLRVDSNFSEKAMSVYSSYFSGEGIVTKQALSHLNSIFLHLLTKVKPADVDATQDITRKKELLFCAIKLIEQDTEPETIANGLLLIGFLIRNNFDNVSIDFQTDQDILELCLRQIQANRNSSCFAHSFTILGILASQGILSLNNSEQFFIRIDKEQVLASIAEAYEPIPSKKIVLECLEKFIHPNQYPAAILKNQIQLQKTFISMKQQVAAVLLKKRFLLHNPLTIYKQPAHVESYAKILYECINVSQAFRKEFLRNNFWIEFLQHKNLRIFCFAYDVICIQKDKVCLIPNQVMKGVTSSDTIKKNSLMENAFYLARAQFYLSKKQTQTNNKQQSTLMLINQICQLLSIEEESKKKISREVEGFLFTGYRIFEETLAQTLFNIFNDPIFDKTLISENTLQIILENLFNVKPEEQLRISVLTAAKLLIAIDELLKLESSKIRQNKKILAILATMTTFFLENGLIFQINTEHGPSLTQRLLFAIFGVIKMYSVVDEKQQFQLYCRVEEKGIQNLLISEKILDKQTLSMCLTVLQKLAPDPKYANTVIDFTGINLINKYKNYLMLDMEQDNEIIVQMLHILSLVIKKSQQYAAKIRQLQIISHFPRYLQHPTNENLRHQTLTLIGNMAKHSPYFFEEFSTNGIFTTIADTVKRYGHGTKNKILRGIIYAVGNVSFYTDRFCKEFTLLLPSLYTALTTDESYLVSNTMSTISNLLRHSNCYLKALIQSKIIKKVIQIVLQSTKPDNQLMFGLNMIKKVLAYPEVFEDHPRAEFIAIYTQKVKLVGEENDCMKKIKTLM